MKKIIVAIISVILCFGLVACGNSSDGETSEEPQLKISDCVDRMELVTIEDNTAYWDIYLNDKFNGSDFEDSGYDYIDLIKLCMEREENNNDEIIDYWVTGYDSSDMLRFSWGFQDYETIIMYDAEGSAFTGSNFKLTTDEVQELLFAESN